jgi:hypothetical protein
MDTVFDNANFQGDLTVLIIPRDMKENSIPQENFSAISAGK